jgi:hypothetical protein
MNKDGEIYELTELQQKMTEDTFRLNEAMTDMGIEAQKAHEKILEDTARLDGFLRGRAEAAQLQKKKGKGSNRDLSPQG